MSDPNKILTVSYGTFSCTLEAFDDPFTAMKAIAEYFRDLAAEDRYFGAEPPTPDAETLHRITEDAINRRVEARISETGLIMRPRDAEPTAQDAVISKELVPATVDDIPTPQREKIEEANLVDEAPTMDAAAEVEVEQEVEAEAGIEVEELLAADTVEPETSTVPAGVDFSDLAEATPFLDAGSVAAKLARIRSAVADDDAGEDDHFLADYNEDQHADDSDVAISVTDDVTDTILEEATAELTDSPTLEATENETVPETTDDTSDDMMASLSAVMSDQITQDLATNTQEDMVDEAHVGAAENPAEALAEDLSEDVSETITPSVVEAVETVEVAAEDRVDEPRRPIVEVLRGAALAQVEDADDGTDEDAADNLDEIVDSVLLDDASDETPTETAENTTAAEEVLDPEAERQLQADLAEIESSREIRRSEREARRDQLQPKTSTNAEVEADVSRLFEATDSRLSTQETSRRRANIEHLKAAVAAREAESELGETDTADSDITAEYREDLARVMHPRRVQKGGEGRNSRRPSARQAPLMLVSELRVDRDEALTAPTSVRPRRVRNGGNLALAPEALTYDDQDLNAEATFNEAPTPPTPMVLQQQISEVAAADTSAFAADDAEKFMQFLDNHGVDGLPDLMEAAAAYMTNHQSYSVLSRPELLDLVGSAMEDDYTREDGLRAFGVLLREEIIVKIRRGQFLLTRKSRFFSS
jgi:pilus assembly protein FimV